MFTVHARVLLTVLALATGLAVLPRAHAYPNLPNNIAGLTTRDGGTGCGGCHNSPNVSGLTASFISPPSKQIVGTSTTYTVRVSSTDADASGLRIGMVIAAGGPSDPYSVLTGVLSAVSGPLVAAGSNGELAHNSNSGALPTMQGPSPFNGQYQFSFTMPSNTTVGEARTLHAVSRIGIGSGGGAFDHASVLSVIAAPVAPTGFSQTSKTSTSVTFDWNGSGPAYRIVRKTGASAPTDEDDGTATNFGNVTAGSVTSLAASTQYTFRIFSRSASNNVFTAGNSLTITTHPPTPAINSSTATVSGTVGTAIPNYTITATNSPTSFNATNRPPGVNINTSTGVLSGTPTAGGSFVVTLSATNAGGTDTAQKTYNIGKLSQTITFATPLPTPTFAVLGTFQVTATSTSNLAIDFTSSGSACFVQSQTNTVATVVTSTAGVCTVIANQPGNGQYNAASQVMANVTIAPALPNAPTLTSIQAGNASASLTFTPPTFNGGTTISSYTATCNPGAITGTGAASPVVVSGLANGTSYTCGVRAVNGAGNGPSSATLPVVPSLDQDGAFDVTFGTAGATPIFDGASESARAVLVDSENRIYVGGARFGTVGRQMAVARFTPNGALDTKYGNNGIALINLPDGTENSVEGLALDREGRILAAGQSTSGGNSAIFTVARLTKDGTPDTTFNGTGFRMIPQVSATNGVARTIVWDDENRHVVAGGWDRTLGAPLEFIVVRLDENGKPIDGYGDKFGIFRQAIGTSPGPGVLAEGGLTGLNLDYRNRLVMTGFAKNPTEDFVAMRMEGKSLDTTFGGTGIVTFDFFANTDASYTSILSDKGSILMVGQARNGSSIDFALLKIRENGTVVFNVVQDQAGSPDLASAIVEQPDGRIVLAGIRAGAGPNSYDIAMARFNADSTPDTTFGSLGKTGLPMAGLDQISAGRPQYPGTLVAVGVINSQYRVMRLVIDQPQPFSFTPAAVNVGTTTLVKSNAVAIGGLTSEAYVQVTGGEWSRNCAANTFTTAVGAILPGDTVCVRHLSGTNVGDSKTTTLVVGGLSATFQTTATFADGPKTLTVTKAGSGAGLVGSSPSGINCGATCAAPYAVNQVVTLNAVPAAGSTFAGWSGACSGTSACTVTMTADTTVTATFTANPPSIVSPRDLNGDGKSDLIFQDAAGNIAAWTMNGTGVFNAAGLLPAGSGWSVTHVADFDGDGKADLLLRHTDGRVLMWIMNGTAPSAQILLQPAASGWTVTHAADMNGDGKADIQWENTAGFVAAWLMNGGTLTSATVLQGAGSGWHITHMADLNGDSKADILWQHTDGTTVAWLMDGLTYLSSAGFTPAGSGWSITNTGDVNGDGKADLVFRNSSGAMMLWVMDGTNLLNFAALQLAGSPWRIDLIGDLDGDGKGDLVWRNTADGSTYATLMNGTATLSANYLMGAASGWTATHLLDLNGDGKRDILWRYVDGTLATWIMNGLAPIDAAGLIGPSTWQVAPPAP